MLKSTSVRVRFGVSLLANGTRAGLSFLAGLLIARGLDPAGYGDLLFLLASFVSVRTLLDLGSSNAFYTRIASGRRGIRHYLLYWGWVAVQFFGTVLLVGLIAPRSFIQHVWLGHVRGIVLLAFAAAFMQQQVWPAVGRMGEALRKTVIVQLMNVTVASSYLISICVLLWLHRLTAAWVMWTLIANHAIGMVIGVYLFGPGRWVGPTERDEFDFHAELRYYYGYCRPLFVLSIAMFAYDFADRWMLQRFGGAAQQGFYQISYQLAAASLLATTSILNVFWKEIAEANATHNHARVARLYQQVNRSLMMFAAIIAGFLMPWTPQVIRLLLGPHYLAAAPVLMLMLLYPVHQSMGQIGGTMFLASGDTSTYMKILVGTMLLNLPITYLIQAPPAAQVPGLGLGALGMAIKMVSLGIIMVNVQAYIIARRRGWKFDWVFQVVGVGAMVASGFAARIAVAALWPVQSMGKFSVLMPLAVAAILYSGMVAVVLWTLPWLIGLTRDELVQFGAKARVALLGGPRLQPAGAGVSPFVTADVDNMVVAMTPDTDSES